MPSLEFFQSLMSLLSSDGKVLMDESSPDFQSSMDRWTRLDLEVPTAIVQPGTEDDVVTAVKELVSASIPFVPASGGHSSFSSIGKSGVIIDLSLFTGVEVDEANSIAIVNGGTLMKEFQTVLHTHKHFAAIGSGTTVGVIPYYLGGGISAYSPFIGYACENIISAKFVSSKGELIHVSETSHPELFWGIRGAGQFLGLFTSLTIKIHPYAKLGTDQEAQRTIATLAFTVDKLDSVAAALLEITESKEHVSAGHFSVAQAPPDLKLQVLLVAPQIFAPPEVAEKVLQSLVELGPIMQMVGPSTFSTHSDHMEYLCAKGDFKRFTQNGMSHGFDVENFRSLVKLHAEYIAACPDAARSGFTVEWHTPYTGEKVDCAFGLGEVEYWLNILSWYQDPKNHAYVESVDQKAQEIGRIGEEEKDFVSYTNTCREGPLEWRYKGQERIARLKALKKEWDPTGIFTKELL